MSKMTTCGRCLFCARHAITQARQCNNPEAIRYRQQVGEWTACPDYAEKKQQAAE